jgi:pre-mycofactocin synthase
VLWGLAASGQTGVGNVLEILRAGIDETLVGIGRASVHDVVREDVLFPPALGIADRSRRRSAGRKLAAKGEK